MKKQELFKANIMKRQLIFIIIVLSMLVSCLLIFSACSNDNENESTIRDWGEWTITAHPTCTEQGQETRVCRNDDSYVETRTVDALGHNAGVWHTTLQPTCAVAGARELRCTRCQTVLDNDTIPYGHDWGAWEAIIPPTHSTFGEEKRVCQRDSSHYETRFIDPIPNPAFFNIIPFENILISVSMLGREQYLLVVPRTVRSVFHMAFSNATRLTTLLFEQNSQLRTIYPEAFMYASSYIASITIPASVLNIGSNAFYGWTSEQTIYVEGRTSAPIGWSSEWLLGSEANVVWLG